MAKTRPPRITPRLLEKLIEQATLDANGREEQITGFQTMIDECVSLPFTTEVLGRPVQVAAFKSNAGEELVALCKDGRLTQCISILDLPLPARKPKGAEWILAYRRWATGK